MPDDSFKALNSVGKKSPAVVVRERRLQSVISNIHNLPSLPTVVTELLEYANSESSSMDDFEKCLRKDQVLLGKVLKMANSSFYGQQNKVSSVSRAIVILGLKSLKSIVLAASTSKILDKNLNHYGFTKSGLWEHSISCAGIAKFIGEKYFGFDRDSAEELFVGGLLHDIGKIVVSPVVAENIEEFNLYHEKRPEFSLVEVESKVCNIDHSEAGGELLKKWNLSDTLVDSVVAHHGVSMGEYGKFNNVLRISDFFCQTLNCGLVPGFSWRFNFSEDLVEELELEENQIEKISDEIEPFFKECIGPLIRSIQE